VRRQDRFGFEGALTFQAGGASLANSFYGVVNLSLLNILHAGETAQLSYNGQQDLQRMELSLSKPYLLNFPVFASGISASKFTRIPMDTFMAICRG